MHAIWGSTWANRSAQSVVDEMEHLLDTYDINTLWMRDEEFTIRPKWVMEICEEIVKRIGRSPDKATAEQLYDALETVAPEGRRRACLSG